MFCQVLLIQLYESDYEYICIVIYGQICNVPFNIFSSVFCSNVINLISGQAQTEYFIGCLQHMNS